MVEYALILAAIAMSVFVGFQSTGATTDRAIRDAGRLLVGHYDNN